MPDDRTHFIPLRLDWMIGSPVPKPTGSVLFLAALLLFFGCRRLEEATPERAPSSAPPAVSLHLAALQGNLDTVRHHIASGSDLDAKDAYGSTPLIIAVTFGHSDVARALIDGGADLQISNTEGSTPLHIAALLGRTDLVAALLSKGADTYARNAEGSTAYDLVAAPFDEDRWIYDRIVQGLGPLGLELDYAQIEQSRPAIAALLRPGPEVLEAVDYAPLPRDDWAVSTPSAQGLDPTLVAELYHDAAGMETLYGLLVIKNGFLVAEDYFNGASVDQKARLQSVTKSYTSALVGIALQEGCLESVEQKMLDFFPDVADEISDPRKKDITIREMLQMRAGYPWEETDPVYWDGLMTGHYPPLIETIPLVADPGTEFHYSNLTSNWLGIILHRACGASLKAFGEEHLFTPIQADVGEWGTDRDGHNNGCADLHFSARDVARFGLLYLNEGSYEGTSVVPAAWVTESLQSYSQNVNSAGISSGRVGRYFRDIGYGYQWWAARVGGHRFNLAWGHGGQLVVLLHDLDLVIVVTSYPFYIQHDDESWKHERANLNLVGKFIASLPVN